MDEHTRPSTHAQAPTQALQTLQTLSIRYELVAVHALPQIRIARSVKSVLLSRRALQRFNAFAASCGGALLTLYILSMPLDVAVLFVPASVGRWCAVAKLLCQLPALLLAVSALRVDMLQRLFWTYEFWFFSAMNVANSAATGLYYQDTRALGAISHWLMIQMNICVDANMQQAGQSTATAAAAVLFQCCMLAAVSLQLTPDTHTMTILRYHGRAMTSNDVLVNTISTAAILMIRTAYRKRQQAQLSRTSSTSVVRCVSYRCRVKLQQVGSGNDVSKRLVRAKAAGNTSSECRQASTVHGASFAFEQLRLVTQGTEFAEEDVVWPLAVRLLRGSSSDVWRRRKLSLLYAAGVIGLALNLVPFIWKHYSFTGAEFTALWFFALSCPTCFAAVFASFYNRRLLRELVLSFDFCYLSAHISLVHVCVCDLFMWDTRCYIVLFNWIAVHWVLTLDALTPVTRQRLGLRIRLVMPVICFVVLAILRVSLDQLVFTPTRPVHDRVLWRVNVLGATVEFRNLPFILNRVWTILLWCLRILWRLATSGDDDRIILQGNVEFVASAAALDRAVATDSARPQRRVLRALVSPSRRHSTRVQPFAKR